MDDLSPQDARGLRLQALFGRMAFPWLATGAVAYMRFIRRHRVPNVDALRREFAEIASRGRPIVVCANHLTMVDSVFLLYALGSLPRYLVSYRLFSWNVAAAENFQANAFLRVMTYLNKTIPIEREGTQEHRSRVLAKLGHLASRGDIVTIFPEGRRSRTGRIEPDEVTYGVGQILKDLRDPIVVCAYVRGERQRTFSNMPEKGDVVHVDLEVLEPVATSKGLRAARDLSRQVILKLKEMEDRRLGPAAAPAESRPPAACRAPAPRAAVRFAPALAPAADHPGDRAPVAIGVGQRHRVHRPIRGLLRVQQRRVGLAPPLPQLLDRERGLLVAGGDQGRGAIERRRQAFELPARLRARKRHHGGLMTQVPHSPQSSVQSGRASSDAGGRALVVASAADMQQGRPLDGAGKRRLLAAARRVREGILRVVFESGSGHAGGSLSQADVLVALYDRYLRVDPSRPDDPGRDRFVLSKGHGGLGLAVVLADRGFFPPADLDRFGETGFPLGMHMDHGKVPGVEVSTGSLGHGLGMAVGMALGAKVQRLPWRTYCLISDGECYEGSIWEAALAAPALGLERLTVIVDRNRLTMDGFTERLVPLEPLAAKWEAFGWRAAACDGHDFDALCGALDAAAEEGSGKPAVVVAETVKGSGVDFMEDQAAWHYGGLDSAMYARGLASIRARYAALGV